MEAIEEALPLYESISEIISMGLASPLRRRAISQLRDRRKEWILDSGTGPGVSSRIMLENGFGKVVGLDPSLILLRYAKSRLGDDFHAVLAVAENLPFRDMCFAGAITCFSLRDVWDRVLSLQEFARVLEMGCRLEIVDVGKPDSLFMRRLAGLYVALGMPIIAKFLISGRVRGNPFQMIVPTFHRLTTNRRLSRLVGAVFGSSNLHEFLFGGLLVIEARRMK